MRARSDKGRLMPLGIAATSVLVALTVVVRPSFVGRSYAEEAQQSANRATADCSGTLATDFACHQARYRDLVLDSGVEAAFVELKDEHTKTDFVKSNCHPLVHVIGRAAAERYGDLARTYVRGDHFCFAGYYHGGPWRPSWRR